MTEHEPRFDDPAAALAWSEREAKSIIAGLAPTAAPDNQTAEGERARQITRALTEMLEELDDQ